MTICSNPLGSTLREDGTRYCEHHFSMDETLFADVCSPSRTKTLLEGSIDRLELDALEDHLLEVAKSREDARTMCTADVIREATKNEGSQTRRSAIRKSLEWEEELRQIKRVLYNSRNLSRLIPFYGVARDVSAYVALIHLRALHIPFLSSVELRRRVHSGLATHVYISFICTSGGMAIVTKVPLVLNRTQLKGRQQALMRMAPKRNFPPKTPDHKSASMGLFFSLDLRIPVPVELQGRPPARYSSFDVGVQMDYNQQSFFTRKACLKGSVVRAGVAPHKQVFMNLARRAGGGGSTHGTGNLRPGREVQQVKLTGDHHRSSSATNVVTLDLTVTEIVHSCAVGDRLAYAQSQQQNATIPNSIKGKIKELFQTTRRSHLKSFTIDPHHPPLYSFLNGDSVVQVQPSAQCEPLCSRYLHDLFPKGVQTVVLRSMDGPSGGSGDSYIGRSRELIFGRAPAHNSVKRCTSSTVT